MSTIPPYIPYEGDLGTGTTVNQNDWNGMFDTIAGYLNGTVVPFLAAATGGGGGGGGGGIDTATYTFFGGL